VLKEKGYTCYAVEQAHDSITLEQAAAQTNGQSKIAVILGHEVFGVQQEVVDACDGCIEIPQYGTKHSMNVSVTAGIVMYRLSEAMRD
jgi:tRNA G18 (ribose-2'-O)-methylase SpoU